MSDAQDNRTPEHQRLEETRLGAKPWMRWGPYLSERQWATVREDYSEGGTAWEYFPHDHARSRAYRWGEDGLLGISDDRGLLCFALALWNGQDPILKERSFGLTGNEGNHGEDLKEYYFYLDSTPTHSYMRALYKYPQRAFPYDELVSENGRRGKDQPEYELLDTGVFDDNRYFDVEIEYAKADAEDILIRISATNRGPDAAPLHILPTFWFRNTWAWGVDDYRPTITGTAEADVLRAEHRELGEFWITCSGRPALLFTENDTNGERLWGVENATPFVKDGINRAIVDGAEGTTNPAATGTKATAHYRVGVAPGETSVVTLRLSPGRQANTLTDADAVIQLRRQESDGFYATIPSGTPDHAEIMRQALAGMLWSKQLYLYHVGQWLHGDPAGPPPPEGRAQGRNHEWPHLYNGDIISMPDKWEYPWFAAWDLAFHCVSLAIVDPEFAKAQLVLLLREWYMHPNGQLPAYEWAFGDVNPPVHAAAVRHIFETSSRVQGYEDYDFLERAFHKLLLNFTWWVNRKDAEGRNIFQGGFLGLDNISVFDRSAPLPTGGHLEQADGTAWMAMYSLDMAAIALMLTAKSPAYEDLAVKFLEHFMYIAGALNDIGGTGAGLWDNVDQFFYDVLLTPDGTSTPLRVRSLVGLTPLFTVAVIEPEMLERLPTVAARMRWFLGHRPDLAAMVADWQETGASDRRVVALVGPDRLKQILSRMLDPNEFLSNYGIRSISAYHRDNPYEFDASGSKYVVNYEPAESTTGLFGGNSNWRGPIWFPINFLLVSSLARFHRYYGDDFLIEHPTGSGNMLTLEQIAEDLSERMTSIFLPGADGHRPVHGTHPQWDDPHWRDLVLFHEYFHGDTGWGLGASHQTGWTGLVAKLIEITAAKSSQSASETQPSSVNAG